MSQLGQDKQVLEYYSQKQEGYFIEIGAYDGVSLSNTLLLENHGWSGICIEPLPKQYAELVKNRKCKTYNCAVDNVGGKTLSFVEADMLSGDIDRIDLDRIKREFGVDKVLKTIQIETQNLTELLKDAGAPKFIEFLSLDTEGSELDILKGLDHSLFTFGYISVEHNYKEPIRSQIKNFLLSKGYIFYRENKWDDDYVLSKGML